MKIKLFRRDADPIYDYLLNKLKTFQISPDEIEVELNDLRFILNQTGKISSIGMVGDSTLMYYDNIFYIVGIERESILTKITISPEYNKDWIFNHTIPLHPTFTEETVMLQAIKYYTRCYTRCNKSIW